MSTTLDPDVNVPETEQEQALPWHFHHSNLISLASFLDDEGAFNTTNDVIAFFEKPWHWDEEWERYKNSPDA